MLRYFLGIFFCILCTVSFVSADESGLPEGLSDDQLMKLGEKMYREGILPSGDPMQAIVMGDIPVDGRMFTCDDCHQRSGLGSVEGTVITWPTNGRELYEPRKKTGAWRPADSDSKSGDFRKKELPGYWKQIENVRPAYTDQSLARVLLTGMDPAGRKLNPIMPLYLLNDRDMAILVHYLKNLSVEESPGVDATTMRFATVITDGVSAEDRQTSLAILQAHIDIHNTQSRHQERRSASGPFYKTEMQQAYRRWQLDVWELHGPPETWPDQLQKYYDEQPVFALLGGLSAGSWQPIHEFCERNMIPSILPLTDFPVISETDWYTLYFSKGYSQEGEATARYLHSIEKLEPDALVRIVYRDNPKSHAFIEGFIESWRKFDRSGPDYFSLARDEKLTERFWPDLMQEKKPDILILLLGGDDLEQLDGLVKSEIKPDKIFLSSELINQSFDAIPDTLRDRVYLTYPYSLPGSNTKSLLAVKTWLQARKIPVTDLRMQAKLYFLGWMIPGPIKNMRSEFFRDYFLEGFDMMIDQDYAIAVYPRLTFGSGQRYASKGCYIVQLTKGSNPELLQKSDWVIH